MSKSVFTLRLPPRWAKVGVLVTSFVGTQALVQVFSALTGFVVVRSLTHSEYAYYTLATSMASTLAVVSSSGFSSVLMYRGAATRLDSIRFSGLVASAASARKLVASVCATLLVPLSGWLLFRAGAGWTSTVCLSSLLIIGTWYTITGNLYGDIIALQYERAQQQLIPLLAAIARLSLTCITTLIAPIAVMVTAASVAAAILTQRLSSRVAATHFSPDIPPDPNETRYVISGFWTMLPSTVFYTLQSQVFLLLLALTGRTGTLADIGALSRYSVIFGVVTSGVLGLAAPILARTAASGVKRIYAMIILVTGSTLTLCAWIACIAAKPLTRLLGEQYANLDHSLRLVILGAEVSAIASVLSGLNQSRGWIRMIWIHVPISICWTGALILSVPLDTTEHAARFAALSPVAGLLTQMILLVIGFREVQSGSGHDSPNVSRSRVRAEESRN